MRFWDSSALVPLFLRQAATGRVEPLLESDPSVAYWWAAPVECWSAFARSRREGVITVSDEMAARSRLERAQRTWLELLPAETVRARAGELLRLYPLRAADALQLASAAIWGEGETGAGFVCLDEQLATAALAEGFTVLPHVER